MASKMGSPALGTYFKILRERRGLSQAKLAKDTHVTPNTIYRIEAGTQEPRAPLLAALLVILGGRAKDVHELIARGATVARAVALADEADAATAALLAQANTDPKRAALLRRIAVLTNDPVQRARIEDYLDLLEK